MDDLTCAINDEVAKSEYYYELAEFAYATPDKERDYIFLGDRHKQYASWLEELKAYRETHEAIRELPQIQEEGAGIKKCLDILKERLGA